MLGLTFFQFIYQLLLLYFTAFIFLPLLYLTLPVAYPTLPVAYSTLPQLYSAWINRCYKSRFLIIPLSHLLEPQLETVRWFSHRDFVLSRCIRLIKKLTCCFAANDCKRKLWNSATVMLYGVTAGWEDSVIQSLLFALLFRTVPWFK